MDFIAIGDTTVDEFIFLKDARVACDVDDENCTITLKWADKIPFERAVTVAGVGNAANAAVSAARLGLSTGLVADIGADRLGDDVLAALGASGVATDFVSRHAGIPTNHHYVLSYDSERTILIRHEAYPYALPAALPAPATLYLSSLAHGTEAYHEALAAYLAAHPKIRLIFQPGTFQMSMAPALLAPLYARSDLFIVNKEEAERILATGPDQEIKPLLAALKALGPKAVIITDGRNGAYSYDGVETLFVPLYPDPRPPFERTGAGDAFASTVAVALTLGEPLAKALLWGPVNSMSVVQKVGAQEGLLGRAQLEQYLAHASPDYAVRPL
jgi:sugar/nucleoside kinase (ribokinase family)